MSNACPRHFGRWISLLVCFSVVMSVVITGPWNNSRSIVSAQGKDKPKPEPSNGKARKVKPTAPETGAPAFNLPNLDEVRQRRRQEPEAPPPIPSTVRSKRKPLESRNGKKFGDPETTRRISTNRFPSRESAKTHHGRRLAGPVPTTYTNDDAFVQNFISVALVRGLYAGEQGYWTNIIRSAPSVDTRLLTLRDFGATVFESAEYASRSDRKCNNTTNAHNYVDDLYRTYLMRPASEDQEGGWDFWANHCQAYGEAQVRAAFYESIEFHNLVAAMTLNGSASGSESSTVSARLDPFNQTGDQLAARDCEWSLPLISLAGRAGLDLGLGLSYSSLVWTPAGSTSHPYLYFDEDLSPMSPGFRLGFASIQGPYFDAQVHKKIYMLISSSGRRVGLRQVGTSNIYEAADSSYLQLADNGSSLLLRTTDGTQMTYFSYANGWQVRDIKDRNGNSMWVENNWRGDIQYIYDSMNRLLYFDSDSNGNLLYIRQIWNGAWHYWATFGWGAAHSMNVAGFTGATAVGTYTGEQIPVLRQVGLPDGSYHTFEYTGAGQINLIRRYTSDNVPRSYTAYDYDNSSSDCPRLTQTRIWADNWTGHNGVPSEVTTSLTVSGNDWHQMNVVGDSNGTVYRDYYGSGWQKGLVTSSEVWTGSTRQKVTYVSYAHDGAGGDPFATNPRVLQTDVYDSANNLRRTKMSYTSFGLPSDVYEFDSNGSSVLRRTHAEYNPNSINPNSSYTDLRIIGLPAARYVCDGAQGETACNDSSGSSLKSKTTFYYDESAPTYQGEPVRHDANIGNVRGNLTSMRRYNVDNPSQYTSSSIIYNTAGSVINTVDALGHTSTISYTDSFSDSTNHSTLAYPTTMTDADGYSSYVQYNYDFGAKTRTEGPPPAGQSYGAIQTFSYYSDGRIYEIYTGNNSAAIFYGYGPNYILTYGSVNSIADSYSFQTFDGLGRVLGSGSSHPGSAGGYRAQMMQYDIMGRVRKQSNPTEINGSWVPTGDDGPGGSSSGPQPVSWTNAVGVTVSGNNLTTTGNGWNTAGAVSTQTIASGDGYVETTIAETTTYRMIGLSNGDTNQDYDDLDFAIYPAYGGGLYIYESGAYIGYFGSYSTGDVLRVAVEGGVVKYRKNGALLYTSGTAPTYPLLVDTSLYNYGSTLNNVRISGASSPGGWVYTEQTYDWKGRPLVTTNQDGTQKYANYSVCGCAGNEIVTLTDEGTQINGVQQARQQKIYSDVLGRQWKTEVLNWNGTVYSTSTNTFNVRDQITNVRQTDNASGTYQDTTMDYDGYGRLASKHVPEQNAGTATVYTYKADDALESVTDARGAAATYHYDNNNRHLVSSISYSAPSGITSTPTVSFTYDEAGNRTSMTDGMGNVSYGYDSLSRMTSETRYFSDLNHYYVMNYGYNLAGQLASVATPEWGRTVGYNYDAAGRLNSVTGSGYVTGYYNGYYPNWTWTTEYVTTFASGVNRRAWGAVKQMTLGNGVQQSLSYNSRMQAVQNQLSNFNQSVTAAANYEYHADGRIQSAFRTDASSFDRSYSYDQAGRIASALTGSEAHGGSTPDGPYREIFSYDVWGNTISLEKRIWGGSTTTVNTSFSNNRGQQNLGYDTNGFVTWNHDGALGYSHEYDAAGKRTRFVPQVGEIYGQHSVEMSDAFDGNGLPNKRIDTRRYIDPNTQQLRTDSTTGYYLHSTMLGGQVIAELNAQGNRTVSYVYVEGMKLASEQVASNPVGALVLWQFNDPITGTNGATNIQRDYIGTTELDPLGADITSPPPPPDPLNYEAPVFSEPTKQTYYMIEGGPTADYGVDSWYLNMVNKDFDAHMAQVYWAHGFRDWAMEIVANNPNVGVLSKDNDGHGNLKISLKWGEKAAGFLLGVNQQIESGELVEAGGYAEVVGYEIGDSSSARRFAHAQKKAPCPPTVEQLMADPKVLVAMGDAWRQSNPGGPATGRNRRREQGGWIFARNGETIIRRAAPGGVDNIDLSHPPSVAGAILIGEFHTHPTFTSQLGPGGSIQPSEDYDVYWANARNIPGLVMVEGMKIIPYGPNRRGSADPRKTFDASVIKPFPGNSEDTRKCGH